MNHPLIETLTELERKASICWWNSEDRTAWREELLRRRESAPLTPLKSCLTHRSPVVPVLTWDSDLRSCFSVASDATENEQFLAIVEKMKSVRQHELTGIALRPGFWMEDSWSNEEEALFRESLHCAQSVQALTIRCGFLSEQTDILMAADLGFSGIQIHAADLDLFQLQLLIELARDCRLTPLVSVENLKQLEIALQTDAPHLALCCMRGEKYEQAIRFVQQSLPRIPQNCTKLLVTGDLSDSEIQIFNRLGIQGLLCWN